MPNWPKNPQQHKRPEKSQKNLHHIVRRTYLYSFSAAYVLTRPSLGYFAGRGVDLTHLFVALQPTGASLLALLLPSIHSRLVVYLNCTGKDTAEDHVTTTPSLTESGFTVKRWPTYCLIKRTREMRLVGKAYLSGRGQEFAERDRLVHLFCCLAVIYLPPEGKISCLERPHILPRSLVCP